MDKSMNVELGLYSVLCSIFLICFIYQFIDAVIQVYNKRNGRSYTPYMWDDLLSSLVYFILFHLVIGLSFLIYSTLQHIGG